VRLELSACLDEHGDAIRHAVRVEVGEHAGDEADAATVHVACAADGIDAGVVLEVRPPHSPRRYRYALDWRAQPLDARPRLLGLAVAEAVDASRLELTAVPEPPIAILAGDAAGALTETETPRQPGASGWTVALLGHRRAFSTPAGVELLGAGLAPTRRLSTHLRLAGDALVEGATVLTASGTVTVRSVSSGARIAVRAGGRLHGELAVGARIGVVHMRGEPRPNNPFVGERLARAWLGPTATAALGADLTSSIAVHACLELGVAATGATARDLGEPVASVGGTWTSFGLAAVIVL
jgi:hypothetical protein